MAATTEIRKGARFGDRYRVIRRLGAGGMATVWLAEDERLGREVALKRLRTDASGDGLRRFEREARLGAALNHPNLVSVFDTFAAEDGALIVMEYVPGTSLEELGRRGPMKPKDVLPILRGIAAGLDHAHAHGVVHRDVKPSNVLVRDDGQVKVADLGIARAIDATQITAEGKVVGTLAYMAPERRRGAGAGGPEADVYALAAIAFELLSGRVIEDVPSTDGITPGRADLERVWANGPPGALAALTRGLAADPNVRQLSATQLVEELDAGLTNEAPRTTRRLTSPAPTRPATARLGSPAGAVRGTPASRDPRRLGPRPRGAQTPGRRRMGVIVALLAVAALAATGIALIGGGSGGEPAKKTGAKKRSAGGGSNAPVSSASEAGGESGSEPTATTSTDGATLNAEGFALINAGRPDEAVPILRRAVASFPDGSTDLNYAYALFNLGHALRLSGDPEGAIPILEQRLRIPNQTSAVAAELALAREEASGGSASPEASGPPPGHEHGAKPPKGPHGHEGD